MSRFSLLLCLALPLMGQAPLVLPFRFATPELPLVLIDISINAGPSLIAVLDTGQGVAPIIVNQRQARDLGLTYRESDRIAGSFGIGSGHAPTIYRAQPITLRLGSVAPSVNRSLPTSATSFSKTTLSR